MDTAQRVALGVRLRSGGAAPASVRGSTAGLGGGARRVGTEMSSEGTLWKVPKGKPAGERGVAVAELRTLISLPRTMLTVACSTPKPSADFRRQSSPTKTIVLAKA